MRLACESDFGQLAEMKWIHGAEDDFDYGEHNLDGADKAAFLAEFTEFLRADSHYRIYVADDGGMIASAMFVCLIPKIPKPNGHAKYIAYLTNVFTRGEYRNRGIGTRLLTFIKDDLTACHCELLFAWPSDNSVNWYARNGFSAENEIFECPLTEE